MIKIIVKTTHEGAEIVSDALYRFSRSGVAVDDAADLADLWGSSLVWDYLEDSVLNRPKEVTVTGFYEGNYSDISDDLEETISRIKENCPFACPLELSIEEVKEQNWTEDWKKCYKIIEVGKISVVPIWKKDEATGEIKVLIDPGSAFGTGEHESTRLCLKLLSEIPLEGRSVIDTGAGSGILGIAAIKLGAKECLFRDIDESALCNLRENLSLNGVSAPVECASLLEGIEKKTDVLLANITADILARMTNAGEVVKSGGFAVLGGIIDKFAPDLIKRFENMGFELLKEERDGVWVGLLFRKKE